LALLGIPLGAFAAMHRGKLPDLATRFFTVLGDATPNWWMALVIIVILASTVGWFPNGQGRDGPLSWFQYIIVPAVILGLGAFVAFVRYTRSQVLEVLSQDHVRTARAKGLMQPAVLQRHVLRNALLPAVTLMGGILPALVSGAALTEGIFNWPGMGRLYLEAAFTRDYPLLLAILTFTTVVTLIGTLAADVAYGFVDPRIKYS
jgi:peptide/nickel transport system permease protein